MVYPPSRSMNKDLQEGMSDGKYKKVNMNRGGIVTSEIYDNRRDLYDLWYGIHEASDKCLPDGTYDHSPQVTEEPHPSHALAAQAVGDS